MLAIALQVWDGDVWLAQRLMGIICSIEKTPRDDVEFIVSPRRNTNHYAVADIASIARQKFPKVFTFKNKRRGEGWPAGPNDLWAETMLNTYEHFRDGKIKSTGVLTMEPDNVFLRPDAIGVLQDEWQKARDAGKECMGHAEYGRGRDGPLTHINGNAVFACDILSRHQEMNGSASTTGWDVFHGRLLLDVGLDTFAIHQKYCTKGITRAELEAVRKHGRIPALFHGVKGNAAMEVIESMIADGSFFNRVT